MHELSEDSNGDALETTTNLSVVTCWMPPCLGLRRLGWRGVTSQKNNWRGDELSDVSDGDAIEFNTQIL